MSPRDPDLTDLIGPFVLDACTPAEEADVRARMVVDPELRREIESYAGVREALMTRVPVPDVAPDVATKAQVMDEVRREAALFVAAGWAEPTGDEASAPRRRRGPVVASLRRPRTFAVLATTLVAIVVAAAIAIGGGGGSSDDASGPVVVGRALGDAAPRGHGRIVVDPDGNGGELRVSGFPTAGAGREYQVWIRSGQGDPRPTTVLFDVDQDGNGRAAIPAQAMEGTDEVLLTSEPDGGSPTPTRDPVLQVVMPA